MREFCGNSRCASEIKGDCSEAAQSLRHKTSSPRTEVGSAKSTLARLLEVAFGQVPTQLRAERMLEFAASRERFTTRDLEGQDRGFSSAATESTRQSGGPGHCAVRVGRPCSRSERFDVGDEVRSRAVA